MCEDERKDTAPSIALSRVYGHLVNRSGEPILNDKGKRISLGDLDTRVPISSSSDEPPEDPLLQEAFVAACERMTGAMPFVLRCLYVEAKYHGYHEACNVLEDFVNAAARLRGVVDGLRELAEERETKRAPASTER
jgi:hypothetical protein